MKSTAMAIVRTSKSAARVRFKYKTAVAINQ
jgi:hypothetical protein